MFETRFTDSQTEKHQVLIIFSTAFKSTAAEKPLTIYVVREYTISQPNGKIIKMKVKRLKMS